MLSPNSTKIHVDIDLSSINKNVIVDVPIIGDCAHVLEDMLRVWKSRALTPDKKALDDQDRIEEWRGVIAAYQPDTKAIKPQYAVERLYELTKGANTYITTEVGQHQMWAAQYYRFEDPNRWMTSAVGTMGCIPAAVGAQVAHPDALVIDIAGEASVLMTMQKSPRLCNIACR